MSFLIPYYCSRETEGNLNYEVQQLEDDVDTQDTESSPSPAPPCSDDSQETFKKPHHQKKRKGDCNKDFNIEILKALKDPEAVDENELFFKSLLPTMKKLDDIQAIEFKIEVQSLLLKYVRLSNKPQHSAAEPSPSVHMNAQRLLQEHRYTPISPSASYDQYYTMSSFNSSS